jgi:hypothetical protein
VSEPTDMNCEQFKELAPAYALAALDEGERLACARHLDRNGPHLGCAEAVLETSLVAARLVAALPGCSPSPQLWRTIEDRLRNIPIEPAWVREMTTWILVMAVGSAQLSLLR